MTQWNGRAPALALTAALLCAVPSFAAEPKKETASFGTLRMADVKDARSQAQKWLTDAGKFDEKAFNAIWDSKELPLVDKVGNTFALGSEDAARILKLARDPDAPAPEAIPSVLKDTKLPAYFRANLSLAYAKALAGRKVYEDALVVLDPKRVKPDQVVDPASFFFHKAVCEHGLMMQPEATDTIARLLDDVDNVPERYKMVAALMHFDMLTWQDKDLGWIARKMDNIQRRLNLTRGGKETQKIQREVVVRLSEMIKELENKKNGKCNGCNGGNCPNGGKQDGPNNMQPGNPLDDSRLGGISGEGKINAKKFKEIAAVWGKLPEKERAKAMVELTRDLPPKYRDAIEAYLKGISQDKR